MIFSLLVIVGISYSIVANTVIYTVGKYLLDEHEKQQVIQVAKMGETIATLYKNLNVSAIQTKMEDYQNTYNGRAILLDCYGKVQIDGKKQLNGKELLLPEVVSVLNDAKNGAFGVHVYEKYETLNNKFFSEANKTKDKIWIDYTTCPLYNNNELIGVFLFSTSLYDLMTNLYSLQNYMYFFLLATATVVFIVTLFLSGYITKPLIFLTRSIQKIGQGDFSLRVPEQGSSEIKKLSKTFNIMSTKLEMLDKSRNQFVSNASHELKTPLTTIKILLENVIYQPEMPKDMQTEFLDDINKEIDRLNLIISDLLTLVSADANTTKLQIEEISFSALVLDTIKKLELVAEQKQQDICVQIQEDCEIQADSPKLIQVVYNLLDNAIKYSPENSKIEVKLIKVGQSVVFSVSDSGTGIPKDEQLHIFDRFYRVDKARSRNTGGTGLGLSIVRQIVRLHQGEVTVESEEGKGSIFTVTLPIKQS